MNNFTSIYKGSLVANLRFHEVTDDDRSVRGRFKRDVGNGKTDVRLHKTIVILWVYVSTFSFSVMLSFFGSQMFNSFNYGMAREDSNRREQLNQEI